MKKSELNRGVIFVIAGVCFLLAAVFTESAFDGLLWGFAGGALGPGIGRIIQYIYSSNRRKIILIANSLINVNISWAYKFFPVPNHLVENWNNYIPPLLSKLSEIAKFNNLIFFISAGTAANIIISYLIKINNKNIYIDFGSAIEFITKGYSTRNYYKKSIENPNYKCSPFIIKNGTIIYE